MLTPVTPVDQLSVPTQPKAVRITGVFTVTRLLLVTRLRLGCGTTVIVAVAEVVTPRFVHNTVTLNTCWLTTVEDVLTVSTLPLATPGPIHCTGFTQPTAVRLAVFPAHTWVLLTVSVVVGTTVTRAEAEPTQPG